MRMPSTPLTGHHAVQPEQTLRCERQPLAKFNEIEAAAGVNSARRHDPAAVARPEAASHAGLRGSLTAIPVPCLIGMEWRRYMARVFHMLIVFVVSNAVV